MENKPSNYIELIQNQFDKADKQREEEKTTQQKYEELDTANDIEIQRYADADRPFLLIANFERNAQIFQEKQPFFFDKTKQFWKWNKSTMDKRWEISDDIDMLNEIDKAIQLSGSTAQQSIKNNYLNAFRKIGRLTVPKDPPEYTIQFRNKVVNIKTGEITEATPEYLYCNPIPWEIGKKEDTPTIDRIFTEWVGEEYVKTLYEIIAYCLLPAYPLHRLFCFIGNGMNGKSSYLEFLKRFLGKNNCTSTELDTLLSSRFEITRMHKKLLCVMGETNFAELSRTSILKKLTGGDLLGFEYKGKDLFDDTNYAKIIIATNNLPATSDKTDGFYRRWLIIDFKSRFNEKKAILDDIPEQEYENLALKSVRILKELLEKREFHNEGSVEDRRQRFEDRSNPLEKFYSENCEWSFDGFIYKWEFKQKFDEWLKEKRFRAIGDRTINHFMVSKGIGTTRKEVISSDCSDKKKIIWTWEGLKWK